jgi:hypothetical protein
MRRRSERRPASCALAARLCRWGWPDLRVVNAVAEGMRFGLAARKFHPSKPSVTARIKKWDRSRLRDGKTRQVAASGDGLYLRSSARHVIRRTSFQMREGAKIALRQLRWASASPTASCRIGRWRRRAHEATEIAAASPRKQAFPCLAKTRSRLRVCRRCRAGYGYRDPYSSAGL